MNIYKLSFLLLTLLIIYLINQTCYEGFDHNDSSCEDDLEWFISDNRGGKHYCGDIGKTISCYDFDSVGRDGWKRCLKTCGACENSLLPNLSMDITSSFSSNPMDDFGIVLHTDSAREWIGKQDGTNDVRETIADKESEDIKDNIFTINSRLNSIQDIIDIISGNNITECVDPSQGASAPEGSFKACNGQFLSCPSDPHIYCPETNNVPSLLCPSTRTITCGGESKGCPTASPHAYLYEKHNYIKKVNDFYQFPAESLSCVDALAEPSCSDYLLFNKIIDDDSSLDINNTNKTTLADMCPYQCNIRGTTDKLCQK